MFRKPIVIGETYVFDILNETDAAAGTSLVTVIKKAKFNKYIVRSVNNGSIFSVHKKYLTPYVDGESYVVRCQYGTTDIDNFDLEAIDLVTASVVLLGDMFCKDSQKKKEYVNPILSDVLKVLANLKIKLIKYAEITNYKEMVQYYSNARKMEELMKESNSNDILKEKPLTVDDKFKMAFESNVAKYINGDYDEDTLIDNAIDIIEKMYPKNLLEYEEDDQELITEKELRCYINHILSEIKGKPYITILIGVSEKGKLCACAFDYSEVTEDTFLCISETTDNFMHTLFPMINLRERVKLEHRFNIITIQKKNGR